MTRFTLLLRNLRYFRAANLAVAAGMAVATAVLTGALLVGDSVRGSLRELAVQRLGAVDHVLVAPRFFDQSLADRLSAREGVGKQFEVVPALLVRGGVSDASGDHRTGGVQVAAVGGDWLPVEAGRAVFNGVVSEALGGVAAGAEVLLQVPTPDDVPRDATLARRAADEVTARPRAVVARVAAEPGFASSFSLEGGQRPTRNAWMNLADLQREVRQPRRANLLLAKDVRGNGETSASTSLNRALRDSMALDDYGLKLATSAGGDETVLSSRTSYIQPAVDQAAERAARRLGVVPRRVSVQLVNDVVKLDSSGADAAAIHYAVAAGISALDDAALAADEIALNEWAASRLQAKAGDRIRLDYYQRRPDGELEEVRSDRPGVGLTFRVARVLPMSGLGADRTLTPEYPGLTDKPSIREAPPELGIKEDLLTDDDEAYWQQHRAAPKLFLNLQTARRLWGDAYGELTGIRVPMQHAADFERELLRELNPADMGMSFRPIKAEQLAAAAGSTDFSMLFVGLSFFLIASAALLVAMLFRLAVEQRARQFGVMQALGFTPRTLHRLALGEGFVMACAGGVIGSACAVGYTALIVAGLRTWWVGAVGTTALRTHVEPVTLVIGFLASLFIAMLGVAWATRGMRRTEPVRLLSGADTEAQSSSPKRRWRAAPAIAVTAAVGGIGMLAAGFGGALSNQTSFFGASSLLLVASLAASAWGLGLSARRGRFSDHVFGRASNVVAQATTPLHRKGSDRRAALAGWSIRSLALRTASLRPARSLLTVSLVALASFLLVTVAAMRQGAPDDPGVKTSGTGGYRLIAQADIPLLGDLNTPRGRELLGVRDPAAPVWGKARFTSLRRWAGQDASCLNLTRPQSPTILGVPDEMIRQQRFSFASAEEDVENPWTLLDRPTSDPDEVPVIADGETARYILKLGVGDVLPVADQSGRPRRLRLVATLKGSIFQSELLMGEANFRRLFPFQSGFGVVLAETSAADAEEVRRTLGAELDGFAVTVDSTADRLAAYRQVANTYLSTFQTLGSLGLLLGTVGLAVVLLRGLIERRAELALLAAVGFRPARRLALVLWENVSLLLAGLLAGTLCALAGLLPTVFSGGRAIYLGGLIAALAAVLFTGLIVLTAAAWLGQRNITPADLRRE